MTSVVSEEISITGSITWFTSAILKTIQLITKGFNMSRAYGWNAKLLIAEENNYGSLSEKTYTQVPFASSTIDSEQGLIASNVLGLGRDPTTPFQDVINVGGELAVPVDLRNIGIWLKAIFGTPTTTEDNEVYTHTFESGKVSLPSYTLEVGLPEHKVLTNLIVGALSVMYCCTSLVMTYHRSTSTQTT